jgi:hypothetical protein
LEGIKILKLPIQFKNKMTILSGDSGSVHETAATLVGAEDPSSPFHSLLLALAGTVMLDFAPSRDP